MKKPTFKEQYDKIVGAYLRDELQPFNNCACFIGNLLNRKVDWCQIRQFEPHGNSRINTNALKVFRAVITIGKESVGLYHTYDIINMENNFLRVLNYRTQGITMMGTPINSYTEEDLFLAMTSTLLMLKQIHENNGEVVDDYKFEKRGTEMVL